MVRLNTLVVVICFLTSALHIYLYTTRQSLQQPVASEQKQMAPEGRRRKSRRDDDERRARKHGFEDAREALEELRERKARLRGPRDPRDPRRPGRPARSPQERAASEGIGRASKWDRRMAYSPHPPANATFHD